MTALNRAAATPRDFFDAALCAQTDPEIFNPVQGESTRPARTICAACTVTAQCLEYALDNKERGIWAGTSAKERRAMRMASA